MPRGTKDGSIFQEQEKRDPVTGRVIQPARWMVRRRYTDAFGREREKKRIVYTARDVGRARREIDRAIDAEMAGSVSPEKTKKTFAELANWYEETYLVPPTVYGESEIDGLRSWKKLQSPLKVLKEEFGKELLVTIDYDRIDDFRRRYQRTPTRHGKPRMVHSVNRALELLRRMLNLAKKKKKWIRANPFDDDEPLIHKAEEVERMVILSHLQEQMIIDACVAPRAHLRPAFIYAIDTAARPNEMFSTRKADVRLDDGLIVISRGRAKMKRMRFVPISDRLRADLEPMLKNLGENDLVFPYDRMRRSFRTACRLASVKGVRWQDLRHTGIMRMLDATKDPAKVMKITGHTTWATFIKYVNLNPEIAREVAVAMNADRAERTLVVAAEIVAEPEPIETDSVN